MTYGEKWEIAELSDFLTAILFPKYCDYYVKSVATWPLFSRSTFSGYHVFQADA